jgi:hypothetical protein
VLLFPSCPARVWMSAPRFPGCDITGSLLSCTCSLCCFPDRSYLSLACSAARRTVHLSGSPTAPLCGSLISLNHLSRRSLYLSFLLFANTLPPRLSMTCPPHHPLYRLFLSLLDIMPTVLLTGSLASFTGRYLCRHTTHCIARFFACRCLARRAARRITCFTPQPMSPLLCCMQYRSFLSIVDVFPTVLLTTLLIPFDCQCLRRRTACCIACFFYLLTSSPPCRSQYRSFRSLVDVIPAPPLTVSLVPFDCRRLSCRAIHCIAHSFRLLVSSPSRCLLDRSFL